MTSADNIRNISPHFATSKIRTSAFYQRPSGNGEVSILMVTYAEDVWYVLHDVVRTAVNTNLFIY